ncbi:hypothetical protein CHS0354_004249 [Potamilus streckersoni]|uniref:Uncharacterized protein n=1 Tax=Potamilus streckersoni TaxID=2493646 RepID=A0AAE0S4D7_9BIVA|nr:hypothetical protein CHS0354_004249 [Potamilus streckersoni]
MISAFALVPFVLTVARFIDAVSIIPDTARFIGDGYNLLMGNPDGDYWSSGGDDPGLLLGRSILSLSKDNIPDELSYQFHLTCHEAHSMMLVYGPKSYQDKLFKHIELTVRSETMN